MSTFGKDGPFALIFIEAVDCVLLLTSGCSVLSFSQLQSHDIAHVAGGVQLGVAGSEPPVSDKSRNHIMVSTAVCACTHGKPGLLNQVRIATIASHIFTPLEKAPGHTSRGASGAAYLQNLH